jgi:hypothetical protein
MLYIFSSVIKLALLKKSHFDTIVSIFTCLLDFYFEKSKQTYYTLDVRQT